LSAAFKWINGWFYFGTLAAILIIVTVIENVILTSNDDVKAIELSMGYRNSRSNYNLNINIIFFFKPNIFYLL